MKRFLCFFLVGAVSLTFFSFQVLAVDRNTATPFPELPEKFQSTNKFFEETNIDRPGDEPVLLYTAWGSSVAGYLRKIGYEDDEVYRIDLALFEGWGTQSPKDYVRDLDKKIKEMREDHGKKVDIIAHSLGGLTARWYIEKSDGAQYVDDLITIAAPNQGSNIFWPVYWMPAGRSMVPPSSFLEKLNSNPLAKSVEYTAVWSGADEIFLFNLFRESGAKLPDELIEAHGNARNLLGGYEEHIELAVSWPAFKKYMKYLD